MIYTKFNFNRILLFYLSLGVSVYWNVTKTIWVCQQWDSTIDSSPSSSLLMPFQHGNSRSPTAFEIVKPMVWGALILRHMQKNTLHYITLHYNTLYIHYVYIYIYIIYIYTLYIFIYIYTLYIYIHINFSIQIALEHPLSPTCRSGVFWASIVSFKRLLRVLWNSLGTPDDQLWKWSDD